MSVKYICRYCQTIVGELSQKDLTEQQLGFHSLTLEEREDIISYHQDGHIEVRMTCDYCTDALATHPELSLIPNPLQ